MEKLFITIICKNGDNISVCEYSHLVIENNQMKKLREFKANFFKALANPIRIQIIDELRNGELSVNELKEKLEIEAPNVSQQLSVLRNSNIVKTRREGNNIYYSIKHKIIFKMLDQAKKIFSEHLLDVEGLLKNISASLLIFTLDFKNLINFTINSLTILMGEVVI